MHILFPRSNLDPFNMYESDAPLWLALERVGLKAFVESLPGGLSAPVAETGRGSSIWK